MYKVGTYQLYIRLKAQRAPSFPILVEVLSSQVSAAHCLILNTTINTEVAGVPLVFDVLSMDAFDNIVNQNNIQYT